MLIGFLIPVVVLGVATWLIWKAIRASPPRQRGKDSYEHDVPYCGNCRYPAIHVTTLHCPECGADYRKAGIIPPGMRRGATLPMKLVGWSVVMLIIGGVLGSIFVEMILPRRSVTDSRLNLKNASSDFVSSVQIRAVSVVSFMPDQYRNPFWSNGVCTLTLFLRDGKSTTARLNLVSDHYSLKLPDGTEHEFQATFDDVAYQEWFELLGTTIDEATFGDEAITTLLHVAEFRSYLIIPGQFTGTRSTSSLFRSNGEPQSAFLGGEAQSVSGQLELEMVFTAPLILLFVAIWLFGIIRIIKLGRLF